MKVLAILALASGLLSPAGPQLSAQYNEIAHRVAGQGLPDCRTYHPDGSQGPCMPEFRVRRGGVVNGWSIGARIEFSEAATRRLTRDEFALLAGHEIAHWYLGHNGSTPNAELAADRLGAKLACEAGFDVTAGAGLFQHLHESSKHPPKAIRVAAVLEAECGGTGGG